MTNNINQNRETKVISEDQNYAGKIKNPVQAFTAADLWNIHKGIRSKTVRRYL